MNEYPQHLADAVREVIEPWLIRCVVDTSIRVTGTCAAPLRANALEMARVCAPTVMAELNALLDTDVDAQRTNPLSVLRAAVRHPTALLRDAGIAEVRRDDFAVRSFPADGYNLSPATWADIDESLVEPGLIWGAWKAKTVLDRRRAEKLR